VYILLVHSCVKFQKSARTAQISIEVEGIVSLFALSAMSDNIHNKIMHVTCSFNSCLCRSPYHL